MNRVCVIGAGPCGLAAMKNLLQAGCRDVVCFDEGDDIGGNWAYTDDAGRASVHECSRTISSRRLSAFDDFPMPGHYPDFPSHRQMLAYFRAYAAAFGLGPHIRLGSRVERCALDGDDRWTVHIVAGGQTRAETFDSLVICSGHHREASVPEYPGRFAGTILHSSTYKRAEPFRAQRVLVVGAGNSAADIAVDVSGLATRTALSVREGTYVVPNRIFGRPVDIVYDFWRGKLPAPLLRWGLRLWLRLAVGRWTGYGLPTPTGAPLEKPPTVSSALLDALRSGRVAARRGIARYDGAVVEFTDGRREEFDAIVMATGFRIGFPFLPGPVVDWDPTRLYLTMMHPTIPSLYFIGLFQPIGCLWRLADHQARVAALQISGRLRRPSGIDERIRRGAFWPRTGSSSRRAIEVDYRTLRRGLMREIAAAGISRG